MTLLFSDRGSAVSSELFHGRIPTRTVSRRQSTFDKMMKISVQMVHPDIALTNPHFVMVRGRLYQLSHDSRMEEEHTQLLVTKSSREMIFQTAHYNPMMGRMAYDKSL